MYVLEIPCFDLKTIYLSKQSPRWIRVNDNKYIVLHKNKAVKVEQQKQRIMFDCPEDEVLSFWWDYFDLSLDYNDLYYRIKNLGELEIKIVANRSKGIHILKQDIFEVMASILVDKNTIQVIAEKAGVKHGESMREMGIVKWYEFPTPERLLKKKACLNGIISENDKLFSLAELIAEGWLDLSFFETSSKRDAFEYLYSFEIFTKSDISKIGLYALHYMDQFPKDNDLSYALKKFGMDYSEFYDWFISDNEQIRVNAGLMRQYLIYSQWNEPARIEHWMKQ